MTLSKRYDLSNRQPVTTDRNNKREPQSKTGVRRTAHCRSPMVPNTSLTPLKNVARLPTGPRLTRLAQANNQE